MKFVRKQSKIFCFMVRIHSLWYSSRRNWVNGIATDCKGLHRIKFSHFFKCFKNVLLIYILENLLINLLCYAKYSSQIKKLYGTRVYTVLSLYTYNIRNLNLGFKTILVLRWLFMKSFYEFKQNPLKISYHSNNQVFLLLVTENFYPLAENKYSTLLLQNFYGFYAF